MSKIFTEISDRIVERVAHHAEVDPDAEMGTINATTQWIVENQEA